jgi:extradiol dioxygenase family protein
MGSVRIDRLDHLVLTVADIDATVEFYTRVLGVQPCGLREQLGVL